MAFANFDGGWAVPIGPGLMQTLGVPANGLLTLDAANEASIFIGRIVTSDGASHTLDTSGSSSIGWRTAGITFVNAGTTLVVGLAAVDAGNGPPARAANAADVISFDVAASFTGGGGGVTANAWQTSVPTTGTKSVANGDLIAIAVQMTARGGADSVLVTNASASNVFHRPAVTSFTGGSYAAVSGGPVAFITFSDGATGWIYGSEVFSTVNTRTWNSGSATKEYGQLFKLPFPARIYGAYGWIDPDADCDVVLYSDPLGTPVAERTMSIDANVVGSASGRKWYDMFSSPYDATADQLIGIVFKPGASNVSAYYRTLAAAGHRVTDMWGADGYGISRASGAFADANSSLDHYYIGLMAGGFEVGGGGSAGGARILGGTVVR